MGVGSINGRYFAANGYTCSLFQGSEGDFWCRRNVVFGSMRQILELSSAPQFFANKTAGTELGHIRCARPIQILPHTSEI